MPDFPHLPFRRIQPSTLIPGRPPFESQRTKGNRGDLSTHGRTLRDQLNSVRDVWEQTIQQRHELGFYEGDGSAEPVPFFLQMDPSTLNPSQLRAWGIDVVAVEDDGFIIAVATSAEMPELTSRLGRMIQGESNGVKNVAKLWEILPRGQKALDLLVGDSLWQRWATLDDESDCYIEVSVSIDQPSPGPQPLLADERELEKWRRAVLVWDEEKDRRVERLERIIQAHEGNILDQIDQADTTNYYLRVSGKCVKDIALNFPYALDIAEWNIQAVEENREELLFRDYDVELLPPAAGAPKVCIIDSGIQEGHRLLAPAVDATNSRSYIPSDPSVADLVPGGGHGTRIAGAVLYPHSVPQSGQVQAVAWLQNARVLNARNQMPHLYPTRLMRQIVEDYRINGTRLFAMSIQTLGPCRTVHMSSWAAELDRLSYDHDVLFILSAGNILHDDWHHQRLGVAQHLAAGRPYPTYLAENSSRIANPAQGCQVLTVGSVCYDQVSSATHNSFGGRDNPSAFSRSGLGMWNMIKPDVVEYGGDYVLTAANTFAPGIIDACPELVCSTLGGHPPVARTDVGTSYAAPKVMHIAAALAGAFPQNSTLLYRALIVQSARWPTVLESNTREDRLFHFRTLGYGIPNLERALENSDSRITFVSEAEIKAGEAHLYEVRLAGLPGLSDTSEFRLEATLSYAARPRRTRQKLRNYVSTRLEWKAANLGESEESFSARINMALALDTDDETELPLTVGTESIPWQVNVLPNSQQSARIVRRQDSTLQKDWATIKGYKLIGDRLLFAVTAHKGWDEQDGRVPYAFTVSLTSLAGIPIYETIRVANQIQIKV
ncbi:S8 family peptidase [Hymenobacter defluvii]|uniref:S8 family peptidase n=1 Tax=Hymenobacter defluvii TaxID=2054411 RepID=A0ABS3THE2_9BACT|nr:S8 family peptidase [Hymenobacter defluvii]MBO3273077.1 S8 family peptidase [Hymenobacter defluvii]